jgi:syntaxin 5
VRSAVSSDLSAAIRAAVIPAESATMASPSIQDRTSEFHSILKQTQKRISSSKVGAQRQALLSDVQHSDSAPSPSRSRSEFARKAGEIGRGITATTAKLQRLAECT